jgi:hypothetical protein
VVIFLLLCAQWTREPLRAAPSIEADAYWSLTPDPLTIVGCEVVPVTVRINDVTNLYGADVLLTFDPNVLEVVDADGNSGNGIQVENAGMLSERIWVARNEADNAAGTARYAVTLLNPAPAVTGSGDFIRIYFRAKAAGTSTLHFSYTKLAAPGGVELPSTATDGSAITTAPNAATVTISRLNSTTARLSWPTVTGVDGYHIYRDTIPYFTPSGAPYATATAGPYDDVGALGNIATNYFYVIRSACTNGFESVNSVRVGEFDFEIVRGAYNTVALPLIDSELPRADDLGIMTGATSVSRWRADLQGLQTRNVGVTGLNFTLSTGSGYVLYTPGSGPNRFTTVGRVPDAGSIMFTIQRGDVCQLNLISLPLDQSSITTADQLAYSITDVYTVSRWNPIVNGFSTRTVGFTGPNFQTRIGYPYWPCANTSLSGPIWPSVP